MLPFGVELYVSAPCITLHPSGGHYPEEKGFLCLMLPEMSSRGGGDQPAAEFGLCLKYRGDDHHPLAGAVPLPPSRAEMCSSAAAPRGDRLADHVGPRVAKLFAWCSGFEGEHCRLQANRHLLLQLGLDGMVLWAQ